MKFYRRVLTPSFLLTIAFLLLRSSGTAHAEMILNGSFELPALTAGSITDFTLGQTIGQGWIVGGQNNVRLLNNPGAPNGVQQLAFLPFHQTFSRTFHYCLLPRTTGLTFRCRRLRLLLLEI